VANRSEEGVKSASALTSYLVHPGTHVLVRLAHGDLLAERADCRGNPDTTSLSARASAVQEDLRI